VTSSLRILPVAFAAAFFLAHLFALPRTLEDLDSVNFAMGVESFDVPAHQPHPPGYPVYILLGKISTGTLAVVAPGLTRDHRAALGLAVWGLIAGTVAVFVFTAFWRNVGLDPVSAVLAAVVAIAMPLFWFTASRPLSDVPGLVSAVAVQAALVRVLNDTAAPGVRRLSLIAAFAAGLLIGLRTQTVWLTGPLLIAVAWKDVRGRHVRDALALAVAAITGALVWAVPLLADSGVQRYMQSLTRVGANDFEAIELLATNPSWRVLGQAVQTTFTVLWSTRGLAQVVSALAIVGVVWLARRQRRTLGLVALAYGPYLVFHLLFQEPPNVRYAIPFAIPIGGLAIVALGALHRRAAIGGATAMAAASLVIAHPALMTYAREGAPIFVAFQDMQHERAQTGQEPVLRMHHQVWWGVRRALEWYQPVWNTGPHPFPGAREWLDVIAYWRSGEQRPIWFLGDLSRTDLKLFDWRSTDSHGPYEMPDRLERLMGDTRFDELSWTELERPRWMLGTGWALTPETAGVASTDRMFPHQKPAEAFLWRDRAPLRVLIGGRFLSGAGPATVSVDLDGARLDQWTITSDPNLFVRWIDLPGGVPPGDGPYATMRVRVSPLNPSTGEVVAGLEQFDAAPIDNITVMYAYGAGWNEPEGNPRTGRLWRWTTDAGTLDIRAASGDLTLFVSGESPLRSYDLPVEVVVRAGDHEVARFTPTSDFTQIIRLPAAHVASGRVTIHSSRTFVPADRDGGPDRRRLGLRIYSVAISR
jgi:hypothetical protein